MARYWVGGATGFLGSHLVRLLLEKGHSPVAISRGGGPVRGAESTRAARVDVLDEKAVAESARGCEGAFLATGKVSREPADAEQLHRLHVLGTRSALAGLREAGVRRVVVASTSGTLAVSEDPDAVADESVRAPLQIISRWPYYRTKYYGEREALDANAPPLFDVVLVNPSLLLGPGDLRESSTADVRHFLERAIVAVPAGGIAFVDVRDAALGMLAAFERGRPGERYILNAKNLTIAAFLQRLERISGIKAPILSMPRSRPLALGANRLFSRALRAIGGEPPVDETSVEMAQYYWYASSRKAETELAWAARDPGETLRDTVQDLLDRGAAVPRGQARPEL
jgi:dihydroflavonol-4-reductase